jgi:hypothetical protein
MDDEIIIENVASGLDAACEALYGTYLGQTETEITLPP